MGRKFGTGFYLGTVFILRTAGKVTLFAELASRGIRIPDNNNHAENLRGLVGQRIKKSRQSCIFWLAAPDVV
ncbi:MAG: hypothetical protein KAU52_04735 [Methanosarcinales archaeon]|nr:hypothetical protein [Methanosarcinales archaeon]